MQHCEQQTSDAYRRWRAEVESARRRELYHSDPIWRLTKLKANWERRERIRRAAA